MFTNMRVIFIIYCGHGSFGYYRCENIHMVGAFQSTVKCIIKLLFFFNLFPYTYLCIFSI